MITLGIRAAPRIVIYAIYDTGKKEVINVEKLKIPAAFGIPDGLKYVRSNLLDILREYSVEQAGIRATESSSENLSIERLQIEGVIQEAFASSELKAYYVGQISSISSRLKIERSRFKPVTREGKNDLEIEGWDRHSVEEREAILTAIGAQNA